MEKFKFYNIDSKYIDFLYEFDKKVPFNKQEKRPYIGIVIEINQVKYFALLFSPKNTHKKYSDNPTYMKIGKQYGIIRFNNMIPATDKALKHIDFKEIDDIKYRNLLIAQNNFIQKNTDRVRNKAKKLYDFVTKDKKEFFVNLSCNFKLLEEKSKLYEDKKSEIHDNTILYLIKHAEELEENGIKNVNESNQIMNEKFILSVNGEKQAKKLSDNIELDNIDVLWSSSYARTKCTAKYIASKNFIKLNIDERLNERKLGDLEELANWMKDKKYGVVQEYLLNKTWKSTHGESCEEATERVNTVISELLENYKGKRIALVSHGALISFLLTNWCKLNEDAKLVFNDTIIEIKEPSITKLTFNDTKLLGIEQIDI